MDTVADYEAWKARQRQQGVASANAVIASQTQTPDAAAGTLNLAQDYAKATGRPVPPTPLVQANQPDFQRLLDEKRNSTILSSAPQLARWLQQPDNATVAKDDLGNLSWWEQVAIVPRGIVSA